MLLWLAVGTAELLTACGRTSGRDTAEAGSIPPPHPGPPLRVDGLPPGGRRIALTVDDGYDARTVAAYVQFAHDSGIHLTFNPNATYRAKWEPHAPVLRPLIASGQVQIANHTYNHHDLTKVTDDVARREIQSNEQWIQDMFGVTSRPWFRPPYGARNRRTDGLAADLGFTRILMWNGDLGDAFAISQARLLANAQRYIQPGVVLLGHANHPTVTRLYSQITDLIRQRNLQPGTLDEIFGTSRQSG
jgi:peptidoglycan/xylan/chitin deacetylase (PgdA/CDA1 family)